MRECAGLTCVLYTSVSYRFYFKAWPNHEDDDDHVQMAIIPMCTHIITRNCSTCACVPLSASIINLAVTIGFMCTVRHTERVFV